MIHRLATERGPEISKDLHRKDLAQGMGLSKSLPVSSLGCWRESEVAAKDVRGQRGDLFMVPLTMVPLTMKRERPQWAWVASRTSKGEMARGEVSRDEGAQRGGGGVAQNAQPGAPNATPSGSDYPRFQMGCQTLKAVDVCVFAFCFNRDLLYVFKI